MNRIGRAAALSLPLLLLALMGCDDVTPAAGSAAGGPSAVVYEVLGPKSVASIFYSADGGSWFVQETHVALPWKKEVQFNGSIKVATLSAQNAHVGTLTAPNSGVGDLTCRITVDGKVVKELTVSGESALVTCASEPL